MIEVDGVRQTRREMRPVYRVWPEVRWWGYAARLSFGLLLLTTLAVAWRLSTPDAFLWIAVCLAAMLYISLAVGLIGAHRISRAGEATPLGDAASRWRFDENGLRMTYALGEQSLDWRAVVRVVEERDRLIFAVTPARNHVLPLRCFGPGQLEAFRALIADVTASGRLGRGVD